MERAGADGADGCGGESGAIAGAGTGGAQQVGAEADELRSGGLRAQVGQRPAERRRRHRDGGRLDQADGHRL